MDALGPFDGIVDIVTLCDLIGDHKAHAILSFVSSLTNLKTTTTYFLPGVNLIMARLNA